MRSLTDRSDQFLNDSIYFLDTRIPFQARSFDINFTLIVKIYCKRPEILFAIYKYLEI